MSRVRCTYFSPSPFGISIRILPCLVSVAFSTELICAGFQAPSSYTPPGTPETSTFSSFRVAFHDSEITRKPWLVPPSEGSSLGGTSHGWCRPAKEVHWSRQGQN